MFDEPQRAVGQAAMLNNEDVIVGGGIFI